MSCRASPKETTGQQLAQLYPIPGQEQGEGSRKGIVKPQDLFVVGKDFNKKKPLILDRGEHQPVYLPLAAAMRFLAMTLWDLSTTRTASKYISALAIAAKLKSSFGNRIVDAKWDMHKQMLFDATIEIKGIDRKGMLLDVSKVISDQLGINIHKITISSDNGIFDGTIELRIHDREEVKTIMNQLRNIDDLQEVQRIL